MGFPLAQLVKNPPAMLSIPGLGRSPGEGKGYSLQYSGLENSMDCSPWGRKESDMTEKVSRLTFIKRLFSSSSLSAIRVVLGKCK